MDYAFSRHADAWLRHPVLGDPSFDAFVREPGNPIHRGAPPYHWPVNGFLFLDPPTRRRYVFVGEYGEGYVRPASRCRLFRERPGGGWDDLGVVLRGDPALFDKDGHTPDVSVVFADGRYHMVYDWGEVDFNAEGGLAYASAERPEGPWRRAPEPLTRNSTLPLLQGRYRRTYAATLIRRRRDWLVVGMLDRSPHGWVLFGMTAGKPDGPYSERTLLLYPEQDRFHPPLLEFYPAFVHGGFLYCPATSVARNRNFNCLFRAPLETAHTPAAWELVRHGSLWHADEAESEAYGIWGQTFSGQVVGGHLHAMFACRDAEGLGTIGLARRPWNRPLKARGFVLSGHQGPSLTLLLRGYRRFTVELRYRLRGTAKLLTGWQGVLGPDAPQSDASPGDGCRGGAAGIALAPGEGRLRVRGEEGGAIGLWVEAHAYLRVERFAVEGERASLSLFFSATEALLGHAERPSDWEAIGEGGYLSKAPAARAKWNVWGRRLTLWSPKGPAFGSVDLLLDGRRVASLDLSAPGPQPAAPVWQSGPLPDGPHALVLQARRGRFPVDRLEVGIGPLT